MSTFKIDHDKAIGEEMVGKIESWSKGQNPWISMPNPHANLQTSSRQKRVRANDYFGMPGRGYTMQTKKD